jgi:hypothetical protein
MFTENLTKQPKKKDAIKPYCCSLHLSFIARLSAATNYRRGPSSEVSDNAATHSYPGNNIQTFVEFRNLFFQYPFYFNNFT